jgi:hypothetical protein
MKYILFANNKSVDVCLIDRLSITQEDICVFFNHLIPLTIWPQLKDSKCIKHYFSRYRNKSDIPIAEVYSGLDKFMPVKNLFDKTYLYRMPHTLKEKETSDRCAACIRHYGLDSNIDIYSIYNLSSLKKKHGVNIDKSLSSGLLMYLHILDTKNLNDEIHLVGFTYQLNKSCHDPEQEKIFFNQQIQDKHYVKSH